MTKYGGADFDEEVLARQQAEERAAMDSLRELGYKNPEQTLFYLLALAVADERGLTT